MFRKSVDRLCKIDWTWKRWRDGRSQDDFLTWGLSDGVIGIGIY